MSSCIGFYCTCIGKAKLEGKSKSSSTKVGKLANSWLLQKHGKISQENLEKNWPYSSICIALVWPSDKIVQKEGNCSEKNLGKTRC